MTCEVDCILCGGTGITISGDPCLNIKRGYVPQCSPPYVPSNYKTFSEELVRADLGSDYVGTLKHIIDTISSDTLNINVMLCSPCGSSKNHLAYQILRSAYTRGKNYTEILDLGDITTAFHNVNSSKELLTKLVEYDVLIIRVPTLLDKFSWANTIGSILEKRVKLNKPSLFLYDGSERSLSNQDPYHTFRNMISDGAFKTLRVFDYYLREELDDDIVSKGQVKSVD